MSCDKSYVIVRSCSCTTCTPTHQHTNEHTHTHTRPNTHTHTHERTRTWITVFAFIILKTEGPSPLPTFTPRSLYIKREGGKGGSDGPRCKCPQSGGAERLFFSPFSLSVALRTLWCFSVPTLPSIPWSLHRLLTLLCCCSALGRHPVPSPRR